MIELKQIASNFHKVSTANYDIFFSYETPIAIKCHGTIPMLIISENDWSRTTGKHLNQIDPDKSKRVSYIEFMRNLKSIVNK